MELSLTKLIDPTILQEIQDSFSDFIGTAALTTDENGVPVTEGSAFTDFCFKYVRQSELGCKRCEECDKLGAIKTREAGKPVVYDCHAGLVDFAAPIMVDDKMIGSFIGGQVRISDVDEEKERKIAEELGVDPEELIEACRRTNRVERQTVEKAAQFLSQIAKILSRTAYQNFVTLEESRKKEEYALYQSDYFMRINEYMKQQLGQILEEAKAAENHEDVEEVNKTLDNVIKKSSNVLSVVDHMVEYLSLTGGDMSLKEEKYDIRELFRPMQDMAYGMQGYDLTFDMTIDDDVPEFMFGDPMRISYIASRLMDYRFMFTTTGWIVLKISVRKFSYASMLIIELSDTGEPLDEEKRRLMKHYSITGKVFDMDLTDESNSGVEVVGLLLYQLSGSISFETANSGTNITRIEIPQLEVSGE